MPRERGDSGQYVSTVGGEDVLGVFDEVEGPVVTSADVAERMGVTRETGRRKLNGLVDEGVLAKRKTAGRVVYWRVDRDESKGFALSGSQEPRDDAGSRDDQSPQGGDGRDEESHGGAHAGAGTEDREDARGVVGDTATDASVDQGVKDDIDIDPEVRAAVERVADGWKDHEERLEARIDAAAVVLDHALSTGNAIGRSDAIERFYDTHPVKGQKAETWWRKNVQDVLQTYGTYLNGSHGYIVEDLKTADQR